MRTVLREVRSFGTHAVPFRLREIKGARRITVHVTHEGVVATKPKWVSLREVDRVLRECGEWIEKELRRRSLIVAATLQDRVLYLGVERPIRTASSLPVRYSEGEFWSPGDTPKERLKHVLEWMQRRARKELRDCAARWAPQLDVAPKRIGVRDQVSRWGACSDKASLSFNWRLIMAPPEVLEYIVVHELAHIREHNHSRRFWSLVERFCPGYERHEKWLDENNDRIMAAGLG